MLIFIVVLLVVVLVAVLAVGLFLAVVWQQQGLDFDQVLRELEKHMDAGQQLKEDLAAITSDLAAIKTAVTTSLDLATQQASVIADLRSQIAGLIANGAAVSPEDLAGLRDTADAAKASADSIVATLTPAAAPPAPVV